jgi:iron complex transport system substrate-binding protein
MRRNGGDSAGGGTARTFVDVTGEGVEVPDRPRRIVAIHDINAGAQLPSLGAPVVGIATRDDGARPDMRRYFDLGDIVEVGVTYAPNIEAIAALEPDLIVGEGFDGAGDRFMDEGVQAALVAIAPVVFIDTFRPVEEVMADFAPLVGEAATESVVDQKAEFVAALEELRSLLGDRWGDVDAANVGSGQPLSVIGPTAGVDTDILTRLGVRWVPVVEEAGNEENAGFLELAEERLGELESDLLLVDLSFDQSLRDSALYQSLEVVRAGQALEFTEPSAGVHWRNYIGVAEDLLGRLERQDICTNLV